jgi:dihydroneopterin aldolase
MKNLDQIELRGLLTDPVIGAYPSERVQGQRVALDVDLWLDTRAAASGQIANTVDYGRLIGELRFLMHACRFALLESAADALCRYILAPPTPDQRRVQVQRATVLLRKPNALAALRVTREVGEYSYGLEEKPFGRVDIVYEAPNVGIYRLRVGPGKSIVTHEHRTMLEAELVIGASLHLQGAPVAAGTAIQWPRRFPHRYDNHSAAEQTVLCVDRPLFDANDEVEVETPPDGFLMPETTNMYPEEHAAPYE